MTLVTYNEAVTRQSLTVRTRSDKEMAPHVDRHRDVIYVTEWERVRRVRLLSHGGRCARTVVANVSHMICYRTPNANHRDDIVKEELANDAAGIL